VLAQHVQHRRQLERGVQAQAVCREVRLAALLAVDEHNDVGHHQLLLLRSVCVGQGRAGCKPAHQGVCVWCVSAAVQVGAG
jgi:hypothetical protein